MDFDAFRQAIGNDPELAFALGCRLLAAPGDAGRHADQAFEYACENSGPPMLWRVTQAYVDAFDARAQPWLRRAIASENDPAGIEVDPGTLPIVVSHGHPLHQDWEICVRSADRERAIAALQAAQPRLMRITNSGSEIAGDDLDAVMAAGTDFYSPKFRRRRRGCATDLAGLQGRHHAARGPPGDQDRGRGTAVGRAHPGPPVHPIPAFALHAPHGLTIRIERLRRCG